MERRVQKSVFSFVWIHCASPCVFVLFCQYLDPPIPHRNGLVFKICVWILVFRRKKWIKNLVLSCREIKQKPNLILFGTPCIDQLYVSARSTSLTHQFFLFQALASLHIWRSTFLFVHCRSFRFQRIPCFFCDHDRQTWIFKPLAGLPLSWFRSN